MFVASFIVVTIAVSAAIAQSNNCGSDFTFLVQDQQDANTVSKCGTFDGAITIDRGAGPFIDFGSVETITGTVTAQNNNILASLKFSNLTSLGGLELVNLNQLVELDLSSLQNSSSGLNMYSLTSLILLDLAKLESTSNLVIQSNSLLTNFSAPDLVHINGTNSFLDFENNAALTTIAFPRLVDVASSNAVFSGNIQNISFPFLTNIAGALTVTSTNKNFDCGPINNLRSSFIVKGFVNCTSGDAELSQQPVPTPSSATSSATVTTSNAISSTTSSVMNTTATSGPITASPNPSSGVSDSGKIGIGVGVGIGGALVLGFLGFIVWRRWRQSSYKLTQTSRTAEPGVSDSVEPGIAMSQEPGVAID